MVVSVPRHPHAINTLNNVKNLCVAVTVISVSVAAVAALVFLPVVATAVGASIVFAGIHVCAVAVSAVVIVGLAAVIAALASKLLAQSTVAVLSAPAPRPRPPYEEMYDAAVRAARAPPRAPEDDIDDEVLAESRRLEEERLRAQNAIPDFGMFRPGSAAVAAPAGPAPLPTNISFLDEASPATYITPPGGCNCNENQECPITLVTFTNPYMVLEEGLTYNSPDIRESLTTTPNRTPSGMENPVFTLVPNFTLWAENPVCPITGRPFNKPYICRETGYTFDLDSLLALDLLTRHKVINFHDPISRQTANQVNSRSVTMYPNFALWPEGTPDNPAPSKAGLKPTIVNLK